MARTITFSAGWRSHAVYCPICSSDTRSHAIPRPAGTPSRSSDPGRKRAPCSASAPHQTTTPGTSRSGRRAAGHHRSPSTPPGRPPGWRRAGPSPDRPISGTRRQPPPGGGSAEAGRVHIRTPRPYGSLRPAEYARHPRRRSQPQGNGLPGRLHRRYRDINDGSPGPLDKPAKPVPRDAPGRHGDLCRRVPRLAAPRVRRRRRATRSHIRIWAPCPPSKKKMQAWRDAGANPTERPQDVLPPRSGVLRRTQVEPLPSPAVPAPLGPPIGGGHR